MTRKYSDVTGDNEARNLRDSREEDKENIRKTEGWRCGSERERGK